MEISNVGESHNGNMSVVHEEKCNANVDLCNLTLSSFSDALLEDCSYFGDDSIFDSSKGSNIKHDVQRIIDGNLQACSDSEQKLDDFDFYHVFEVIDNLRNEVHDVKKHNSHKRHKKRRIGVNNAPIKKGQRYLPNFKQRVLNYASNHTFKATALHFNINCNTITEWARESKRLSQQQKSTTSMPDDSVCQYKTDILCTPAITTTTTATKTDIIIINDSFTIETDNNDDNNGKGGGGGNEVLTLPPERKMMDMRCDERFLEWIRMKRLEGKELSRSEVYNAALDCANESQGRREEPMWFMLWLKRYNKSLGKEKSTNSETDKYIMYPNKFKIEVALYARSFTKNSAARVFNVPRRRIFDWFKCWDGSGGTTTATTGGGSKTRKQVYTELHDWYKKKLSEGFSPNSKEIKAKARELFNANGIIDLKFSEGWLQKFCKRLNIKLRHADDDDLLLWILAQFDNNVSLSHQEITDKSSMLIGKRKEFKGSKGWTLRFLKRYSNFLQHVPTHDDRLPDIVQSKIRQFRADFRYALAAHNIGIGSVGCMDEVPITFSYQQDGKTTGLPLLRKTGFENCQAVVVLCVLADGRALPPTVVLRGKGTRQVMSVGQVDALVLYQESGVVDCDVIDSWTRDVWLNCVTSPSILVLDSFQPHRTPQLRDRLRVNNSFVSIIPEGCSSQLQPLDVEVTPKFKESIKSQWKVCEGLYATKMGKAYRCPDQDVIISWIRDAYRRIEENPYSIMKSFKVVGLID